MRVSLTTTLLANARRPGDDRGRKCRSSVNRVSNRSLEMEGGMQGRMLGGDVIVSRALMHKLLAAKRVGVHHIASKDLDG